MTKREEFLVWIDELIKNQKDDSTVPMNDSVKAYLDAIRDDSVSDSDKPQFTENGKAILIHLQSMPDGMYSEPFVWNRESEYARIIGGRLGSVCR